MAVSVLVDTDVGSAVDDALALSYLLSRPDCELVGITTVSGDVVKRAAIAEILCHQAGKSEIQIVAGQQRALSHGPGQPDVPHYPAIAAYAHSLNRQPDQAVDFMRKTIRERPGEITLLTIGPLTNVALLFGTDPETPFLLKGLVSMAGAFQLGKTLEWNCRTDPVAASIVTSTPRPSHLWIGLDVTEKCALVRAECEERFTGPLLGLVRDMAAVWFSSSPRIVFHDPLAAACIFEPELVSFEAGTVTVDLDSGASASKLGKGTDQVADGVNAAKFIDHFFDVVAMRAR